MKNLVLLSILFLGACSSTIKDEKSEKENPVDAMDAVEEFRPEPTENLNVKSKEDLIGYWVGWFVADLSDSLLSQYISEGVSFSERNKINISIDKMFGDSVFGHSVVANNYRSFSGTFNVRSDIYTFKVAEPGTDKHDGSFLFQIGVEDTVIKGYWTANYNLPVKRRLFSLKKKNFYYNPKSELMDRYVDIKQNREQDSFLTEKELYEHYGSVKNAYSELWLKCDTNNWNDSIESLYKGYILEDENAMMGTEYLMTSPSLYAKNPSVDTLTSEFVSELSKADIYILRNSIYARHGYSFKKRQLRAYFDKQDWYIPVHANIKSDLTEIEKKNIQLLLKYEEHAEEYYDEFGRG